NAMATMRCRAAPPVTVRTILRLLAAALIAAALFDPALPLEGPGARVVLVDRSRSFAPRLPAALDRVARLDPQGAPGRLAAAALDGGLAALGGRRGDLVLPGDGVYPPREALAAAARAAAAGVAIHALCPEEPEAPLVAVDSVRGPLRVR